MVTTRKELSDWLQEGARQGATHMIVVCDTFDYEEYPVYVLPGQQVREVERPYDGKNMQRIMEVYSYALPIQEQLCEGRAFHYDES